MRELDAVLEGFDAACRAGDECVLATVVRVTGSTYRRAGARLLVSRGRWLAGSISGGCLEADLLKKAAWRTSAGRPVLVRYDSTGDDEGGLDEGFGLGCRGVVEVLLERVGEGHALALRFLRRALSLGAPAALVTIFAAAGAHAGLVGARLLCTRGELVESSVADPRVASALLPQARDALAGGRGRAVVISLEGGVVEACVELIGPPTPLVLFGQGHDIAPVVAFSARLGWQITVVENRPAGAPRRAMPGARVLAGGGEELPAGLSIGTDTLAVLMTHSFARDRSLLRLLLRSPARYIGVLGPRRRTDRLLDELRSEGVVLTPADLARLHGPVGLDLGADSPEEIALSIVSELQAVVRGREGGALRHRPGPIHPAAEIHGSPPPLAPPAEAAPMPEGEGGRCDR